MSGNTPHYHRHSIRLKGYDYTSPGAYYITLVTYRRVCLFGDVSTGEMAVNQFGRIVECAWESLVERYSYLESDTSIVMPNHFHAILRINEINESCRGGSRPAPTDITPIKPLGELIGAFKTISAKNINRIRVLPGNSVWQRNYYEHIIRDQNEMNTLATYIQSNPTRWVDDPENNI